MTTTLCPHILDVEVAFHQKCIQALLKNTKKLTCPETGCSHGLPGLWACLGPNCTYIGCGRSQNKHLLAHYNWSKKSREEHCVCINLSTRMIWCYDCDNEIIDSDYAKDDAAFIENLREVLTSQAPAPRPSTALTVSSSSSSHARGACGLANLGNTCYANAALQSLAHCPPLRSYFLQYMARQVQGKKKTSHLVFHFTQLLYDLWGGQLSSLRPTDVLREVRRFNPMFGGYAQQDSQEFMRCLLDRLHEDTKEELPRPPEASSSLSSSSSGEKEKETKPGGGSEPAGGNNGLAPAVDLSMVRPTPPPPPSYASVVSRLFQGFLLSRIKCLKCGKVSPTKDAFYDLSIPIPDDKMLDKVTREGEADGVPYNSKRPSGGFFSKLGNWLMLSNRTVTLEDCLQAFCTKEELMGADRYRCEHCKTLNDSQKFLRIAQPPEVLCIHIKRFRHDSYFGGKLSDVVQFPLRDLDLSRFCEQETDGSLKYDLVAVVNHIGGLSGGHYIAYALNDLDGKWYEFDDSWATPVSEETVKNKEAYVLLYQRRMPTEKELERKRLQAAIAAFQEDEEIRRAAALSNPPEASPDNDCMHVDKNGVIELKKYFVCQEWITRWKCTTQPGPIYNAKYLCSHGLVRPQFSTTQAVIHRNFEAVPEEVWARFVQQYGGGPAVCESQFGECQDCKLEAEQLRARRKEESKKINEIDRTYVTAGEMWYLISAKWLQHWADFSRGKAAAPPGPIDNWSLLLPNGNPRPKLKCSTHYRGLVREVWEYFHSRYGGGPVLMRPVIDIYAGTSGGRSRSSSIVSSSAARPIRSSSTSLSASRPLSPVASPSTSATSPTSASGLASSTSPRSPSSPYASFTSNRRSSNSNGTATPTSTSTSTTTASPSTSPTGSSSSSSTLSSAAKRAAYYKNLNIAQNGTHGERRQPSQSPQQHQQQNARAKAAPEHVNGRHDSDEVEMDELARPAGQSKTSASQHRQRYEHHHRQHHEHDDDNGNEEDEEEDENNGTNGVGRARKGGPARRNVTTGPASPSRSSHLDRMLEDD